MKQSKWKLGLFLTLPLLLSAQETTLIQTEGAPTLEKNEQATGEREKKPAKEKSGFVRVWQFAELQKKRVSVSLKKQDGSEVILGRGMPYARILSYQPIPVGKYRVFVREYEANAVPNPEGNTMAVNLKPELPLTPESRDFEVTGKSYVTFLIQKEGANLKISPLMAEGMATSSRKLKLFNFLPGQPVVISCLKNNTEQVIFAKNSEPKLEKDLGSDWGITTIFVSFPLPNGQFNRQVVEVNFNNAQQASLLIHNDRYGRLTVTAVEDLPVGAQAPAGAP